MIIRVGMVGHGPAGTLAHHVDGVDLLVGVSFVELVPLSPPGEQEVGVEIVPLDTNGRPLPGDPLTASLDRLASANGNLRLDGGSAFRPEALVPTTPH